MTDVPGGQGWRQVGTQPAMREALKALLVLVLLTVLTRVWVFGDPVVNIDEQFYLMAGDRLLHGELPYVAIWDRKPIGLFLIYAFACRAFADPALGYQLLAALSVALTGWLVFVMARRQCSFAAALGGAAAYPVWLLVFGGIGGQSPVYYNLPMAAAAALTGAAMERGGARGPVWRGCAIMLLTGIAIQIKYTVVFEGIFFGLSLLWTGRTQGVSLPGLAARAMLWIACALLPTVAAFAVFASYGHGTAFIQANFLSIFGDSNHFFEAIDRLFALTFGLTPFLACLWIVWRKRRSGDPAAPPGAGWALAWFAASYAGFLFYGMWNDHYVLPLLLPLSLIAALAFDCLARQRRAIALLAGLGLLGGGARAAIDVRINGNAAEVSHLAALVRPLLGSGCLYVNEDLSILYMLARSCLPTRYVFPQHLALVTYQQALGIDQLGELRRLLAQRPAAIVISTQPDSETRAASRQLLEAELRAHYRQVGTAPVGMTTYAVFAPSLRPR